MYAADGVTQCEGPASLAVCTRVTDKVIAYRVSQDRVLSVRGRPLAVVGGLC